MTKEDDQEAKFTIPRRKLSFEPKTLDAIVADMAAQKAKTELENASLEILALQINSKHAEVVQAARTVIRAGMDAGDCLLEVKRRLPHGQFGGWLSEHCAVGERQAQRYMKLATNRKRIEANSNEFGMLTIEGAIDQLAPKIPQIEETKTDFEVGNAKAPNKWYPSSNWSREADEATAMLTLCSVWHLRYCQMYVRLPEKERDARRERKRELRDKRRNAWLTRMKALAERTTDPEELELIMFVFQARPRLNCLSVQLAAHKARFGAERLKETFAAYQKAHGGSEP